MTPSFPCTCPLMPNSWVRYSWAPPPPGEWVCWSTTGMEACPTTVRGTHIFFYILVKLRKEQIHIAMKINDITYNFLPLGTYSTVFTEIGCIPMVYNAYIPGSGWMTIRWERPLTNHRSEYLTSPLNTMLMFILTLFCHDLWHSTFSSVPLKTKYLIPSWWNITNNIRYYHHDIKKSMYLLSKFKVICRQIRIIIRLK